MPDCNHRIRNSDLPVRKDVCCRIKELGCDLVQDLALERNSLGKNYVECRNAVRDYHYEILVVDVVHVAYLSYVV